MSDRSLAALDPVIVAGTTGPLALRALTHRAVLHAPRAPRLPHMVGEIAGTTPFGGALAPRAGMLVDFLVAACRCGKAH